MLRFGGAEAAGGRIRGQVLQRGVRRSSAFCGCGSKAASSIGCGSVTCILHTWGTEKGSDPSSPALGTCLIPDTTPVPNALCRCKPMCAGQATHTGKPCSNAAVQRRRRWDGNGSARA